MHTEPIYRVLHVLNVDQIRDYSIALFMYKLTKPMLPSMFEDMFISMSDVHNSTKRTQRTIKHFGTKLWNSLCNALDIDCAISTFKHRMKIFHFSWSLPILYLNFIISLLYNHMNMGHISLHFMPPLPKLLHHCACLLMLSFMLWHAIVWLIPLSV